MAKIIANDRVIAKVLENENNLTAGVVVSKVQYQDLYRVNFDLNGETVRLNKKEKELTVLKSGQNADELIAEMELKASQVFTSEKKRELDADHFDSLQKIGKQNRETLVKTLKNQPNFPEPDFGDADDDMVENYELSMSEKVEKANNQNSYDAFDELPPTEQVITTAWNAMTQLRQNLYLEVWENSDPSERMALARIIPDSVMKKHRLDTEHNVYWGDSEYAVQDQSHKRTRGLSAGFSPYLKNLARNMTEYSKEQEVEHFDVLESFKDDDDMETAYLDRKAMIVEGNFKVAFMVAKKFAWTTRRNAMIDMDDLFQSAVEGLHKAVDKWDAEKGHNSRFSDLAYRIAWNAVSEFVGTRGVYTMNRNEAVLAGAIYRWGEELMDTLERRPTVDELWDHAQGKWEFTSINGMDKEMFKALYHRPMVFSIDERNDDDDLKWDIPQDERTSRHIRDLVDGLFKHSGLTGPEYMVMRESYGFNSDEPVHEIRKVNVFEVAGATGVPRGKVSEYQKSGLAKMVENFDNVVNIINGAHFNVEPTHIPHSVLRVQGSNEIEIVEPVEKPKKTTKKAKKAKKSEQAVLNDLMDAFAAF